MKKRHELNVAIPDVVSRPVSRRTMIKGASLASVLVGFPAFVAACGGDDDNGDNESGASGDQTLNFYNWTSYIDDFSEPESQQTVPLFESETGIEVNYRTYASNDELLAKLREGGSQFDLVVPTDYLVQKLIEANLLLKLDQAKIPNLENLDPKYANLVFDVGNEYSLAWANGNTGIGFNGGEVAPAPVDAAIFGDSKYKGKMTLLDEMRSTVPLALFYTGVKPEEATEADLDKAFEVLNDWKPNISISSDYQDPLGKGDLLVAHAYSGDVFQQKTPENDLKYLIPPQGADQYIDCMCIPNDAPHPDNALTFMNYIYEPEVSAGLMKAITYRNGNAKAYPLLPPELLADPVVFPPPEVEERLSFVFISQDQEEQWRTRWDDFVAS